MVRFVFFMWMHRRLNLGNNEFRKERLNEFRKQRAEFCSLNGIFTIYL